MPPLATLRIGALINVYVKCILGQDVRMLRNKGLGMMRADSTDKGLRGIQDVAEQLGVTHRTLRFYEDEGLIEPQRVGTTRVYSRRDVGRMQLILRGKRLGFSIKEIKEFLDLYDMDPQRSGQTALLLERVRHRLAALEAQQRALSETIGELREIEEMAQSHLAAAHPA